MTEELRQVRDTLIEALRRSDMLTLEGRALFRRYAALSEAAAAANTAEVPGRVQMGPMAAAQPTVPAAQPSQATRRRPAVEEEDEFGGSFMVRNNPSPTTPGDRETPPQQPQRQADLPRSMRDRRR